MKLAILTFCFLTTLDEHNAFTINNPIKIGQLSNNLHDIGGTVYALGNNKIFIKDFTYDGTGPDAFFFVGESGTPSRNGIIVPYPDNGKCYDYRDKSAPLLTRAFTGNDVTLTLPCSLDVTKVKWLSVWCRAFSMDFGSIIFPNNLTVDEDKTPIAELEPESFVEPENIIGDKPEMDHHLSVYPEPESEPHEEE